MQPLARSEVLMTLILLLPGCAGFGDGAGDEEVQDHPVEDPAVDHLHRAQAEAQSEGQQRDVARRRGDRRPGRRVRLRQLGKLNRL